ncbi:hypothetical protein BDV30DRAFT_215485 [Aspergillus minisclerotigenes]|uniref:Histidine kinase-like ATPase n=1 Tax=Aspergillus minisclerotigenes TaxID=656917 RepID=A0A5N6IV49_9EURO|nr:hypothetical protein BDV30DRAFT_215485 [Aspergillus minisclerotigenes]
MSRKVSLDAVVSHIHDALSQEGDSILIPRDVLSTILDAVTQSVNTEKALAWVEADCLSVRSRLEAYKRADDLVVEELCQAREKITAFARNKFSDPLVQSRKVSADTPNGIQIAICDVPNEYVQEVSPKEYPVMEWMDDTANTSCKFDKDLAELPRSLDLYEPFRSGTEVEQIPGRQIDAEAIDASKGDPITEAHYFPKPPNVASSHGFEKHISVRTFDEIIKLKNSIRHMTSIVEKRLEHCISARETVEEAYRSKSELLATMSHEIRTPIHGIIGMAQLGLEAGCLPAVAHDAFNLVHSLGKSLLANINNVLDLSRIEASRMVIESIPFNLGSTVLSTLKPLAVEASKKMTDLTYEVGSHVPQHAIGDPNRLCQILFNLVGNAVKFTNNGRIELSVKTAQQQACAKNQCVLEFSVADTGVGIPPNKLELIFDRFQQADDSVMKQFGGTGLGLAISRKLVSLMGGDIWVRSTVGKGSIFSFTCPLKLESPCATITEQKKSHRDFVIFYITANGQKSDPICKIITEFGIQVRVFNQRDIQIQEELRDQNHLPDALIVESLEMACALRAHGHFGSTPLVLFDPTPSDSLKISIRSAFDLGIVSYITSPCSSESVLSSLLSALQDRPRHLEPSQTMPLSVLIAEDNDICRLVAAKALEKCTSDITVVTNGLQALQAYQNRQFDVIIMDIQMPVMDGLEAVSEIRNYERTHNTKRASIIAITADTIDDDRPGAEMDEYVSKPLNPNQLRDVVLTCHSEGAKSPTIGDNMDRDSACEISR